MMRKGCTTYLAYVKEAKDESPRLEDIRVVREYSNVFSDDLLGLPPKREIEFGIELLPGTEPISIPPYRITPIELRELIE